MGISTQSLPLDLTNDNIGLSLVMKSIENESNEMVSRTILQSISSNVQIDKVAKFVHFAVSDNTRLAYQGDLADFLAWGGSVPCTPEMLASYIASRAEVHSPYTISRRVVGISRAHVSQGLADPAKSDLVRTVLRGVRRKNGVPQRQVAPVLRQDLLTMLPLMHGTKGVRDRALILLGFAAALRRSELVALDVQHLQFVKEGLLIHQRWPRETGQCLK
jgi:integrase